MEKRGWLVLEDGSVFEGCGLGAKSDVTAEFVFNTGMTGYYEMLSDPASAGLGIVTTFPVIGSWGAAFEDKDRGRPCAAALICRQVSECPSDGATQDIGDYMLSRGITGLSEIDTRQLTRLIRKTGSMRGAITFDPSYNKAALIKAVKTSEPKCIAKAASVRAAESRAGEGKKIAILDAGAYRNIFNDMCALKYSVTAYPLETSAELIINDKPDGIIISDGPGDPKTCNEFTDAVKKLIACGIPLFGIGLGHQLMALASGFDTFKMPHGHRGANYPVKETATGKAYITTQNHGYAVDNKSVDKTKAEIAYTNLHDGTVEGLRFKSGRPCMSLQYYPQTGAYVLKPNAMFTEFLAAVGGEKNA